MADNVATALKMTREMKNMPGLGKLDPSSRAAFVRDLSKLEATLSADPYAEVTALLEDQLRASAGGGRPLQQQQQQQAQPAPPPPPQTSTIGERTAAALEAVNFPGFVASLVTGTFQAIVDASAQQIKKYAELIADITQSLESFSDQNVTPNQARDELAQKYSSDLFIQFPPAGTNGTPKLLPRPERVGESPSWLSRFELAGEELTEELTEGKLLQKGRTKVGEDRLQMLATLVLMGINRVVVNEGDLRAKLQFHATARDTMKAHVEQTSMALAQGGSETAGAMQMMVSTLKANAQADASIKADLMGEVRISFRSETFPLERFADSAAIQLINRHARWKNEQPPAQGAQPAGTAPPAAPGAPAPGEGGTPK